MGGTASYPHGLMPNAALRLLCLLRYELGLMFGDGALDRTISEKLSEALHTSYRSQLGACVPRRVMMSRPKKHTFTQRPLQVRRCSVTALPLPRRDCASVSSASPERDSPAASPACNPRATPAAPRVRDALGPPRPSLPDEPLLRALRDTELDLEATDTTPHPALCSERGPTRKDLSTSRSRSSLRSSQN